VDRQTDFEDKIIRERKCCQSLASQQRLGGQLLAAGPTARSIKLASEVYEYISTITHILAPTH